MAVWSAKIDWALSGVGVVGILAEIEEPWDVHDVRELDRTPALLRALVGKRLYELLVDREGDMSAGGAVESSKASVRLKVLLSLWI